MESRIFGLFVLLISFSYITAHNWLDTPVSRGDQRDTQTGCRIGGEGDPYCPGPCDRNLSMTTLAPTVIQRGQTLQISWNMHNHDGGFVRLAWCPTSQSDSQACFDAHVQQYTCKQHGGCTSDSPLCSTTISAPTFLSDGTWTLQWAYFGGYFQAGDYYACTDYSVSGGSSVSSQPAPTFVGGDTNNPNSNVCLFYNTDALHVCVVEPCTTGTYPIGVAQNGIPSAMNNVAQLPSTTGLNIPSTTGVNTPSTTGSIQLSTTGSPQPSTTGYKTPATTAAPIPVTTGSNLPSTTGKIRPLTTGSLPPATTGVTTPATTAASTPATTGVSSPASAGCVNGQMKCVTQNTFSTCTWGIWSPTQTCASGTSCAPSGNYIYCVNGQSPIQSPSTTAANVPVTPSTTAAVTPATTAAVASTPVSPPSSAGCTFGYQRCSTSNSYQTCTYGSNGFVWSASQSCQTGLQCHQSSNSIYCY